MTSGASGHRHWAFDLDQGTHDRIGDHRFGMAKVIKHRIDNRWRLRWPQQLKTFKTTMQSTCMTTVNSFASRSSLSPEWLPSCCSLPSSSCEGLRPVRSRGGNQCSVSDNRIHLIGGN